jgi:HD-like signal output (HDOD) protein
MAASSENLRELLRRDGDLPTLPEHIQSILKLLANGETPLVDIGREIEKDPALTLRVVRLANSAAFGRAHRVNSLPKALAVVGLGRVRAIIAGFASVDVCERFLGDSCFNWREFWAHCGATAFIARTLAERLGLALGGAEFLAGLLHDLGYLALAKFDPEAFAEAVEEATERRGFLNDGIRRRFGLDVETAGGILAEVSNLATETREVVLHAHHPSRASEPFRPLVSVVSLANEFAHLSGLTFFRGSADVEVVVEQLQGWTYLSGLKPEMADWDVLRLIFDLEREHAASQDFIHISRSK